MKDNIRHNPNKMNLLSKVALMGNLFKLPNLWLICQLKVQLPSRKNLTIAKVRKVPLIPWNLNREMDKIWFIWRRCYTPNCKLFLICHLEVLTAVKPFLIGIFLLFLEICCTTLMCLFRNILGKIVSNVHQFLRWMDGWCNLERFSYQKHIVLLLYVFPF